MGKNAKLRYSTIENWSKNMYNLNTKRALVEEGGTIEWVSGSFGSHVSYLYPMSVLNGKGARAEFTGITFAGAGQNLDTGYESGSQCTGDHFLYQHEVYLQGWRDQYLPKLRSGEEQCGKE